MNNIEKANAYAKDKKWKKAEKMLLKHINGISNVSDLHFAYNSLIDYSYKQRKEDVNAIDRCLSYCLEDISLLSVFKRGWNEEYNDFATLRIPSIDRSIRILKKQQNYDKLKNLLEKIIEIYNGTEKEEHYKQEIKKIKKLTNKEKNINNDTNVNINTKNDKKSKDKDILKLPAEEIKAYFEENKEWFCTLSFKKSRSKNFPQALDLAKQAPKYDEYKQKKSVIYQATYGSNPDEYLSMLNLWELIKNWKSSFMNINGEIVDKNTFSKINRCYSDKCRNNTDDFCYGVSDYTKNPLGCHRAKIHESGDPWYKFGSIDNNGIFNLNKKTLKEEAIKRLISYKYCPALDINEIIQNIDNLPDKVDPQNNDTWEYTTYLNTSTDTEYNGITKKQEPIYNINVEINGSNSRNINNNKNRVWPWFIFGGILTFTPLWFIGLGCLFYGGYKKIKNK
ncbi:hypothetical protein [Halanaerobium congolense]|jgi:hypothetical protein|uniref:Uncharacterized protein n=1 Tax=Halanaerobium congolense TaxID=54121 RepID=A0A4R7DUZ6_9FIRM|nr:hypothetical protein [Halanaerobium congolense]TDS25870.1 hypothetical protein BY453_1442 [Halanaerobium congolense]